MVDKFDGMSFKEFCHVWQDGVGVSRPTISTHIMLEASFCA